MRKLYLLARTFYYMDRSEEIKMMKRWAEDQLKKGHDRLWVNRKLKDAGHDISVEKSADKRPDHEMQIEETLMLLAATCLFLAVYFIIMI